MCGHDWCSVRIRKEIQEFASGKAPGYGRDRPVRSDALTPEQQAVLEQRGVLPPEEIHRLATKVKRAMSTPAVAATEAEAAEAAPACHSDYVSPEEAERLQSERAGVGRLVRIGG